MFTSTTNLRDGSWKPVCTAYCFSTDIGYCVRGAARRGAADDNSAEVRTAPDDDA